MQVICINDPNERMFKGRVILTKNVVNSILRQQRGRVTLRERNQLFRILEIVNGARFDSLAAVNSVKSYIFSFNRIVTKSNDQLLRSWGEEHVPNHQPKQVDDV